MWLALDNDNLYCRMYIAPSSRVSNSCKCGLVMYIHQIKCISCFKLAQWRLCLRMPAWIKIDIIDRRTLLNRLQRSFGITGHTHDCIRSCLSNRKQFVRIGWSCSTESICHIRVPRGRCWGQHFSHSTFHQSHPSTINRKSHNDNMLMILGSTCQCQIWNTHGRFSVWKPVY